MSDPYESVAGSASLGNADTLGERLEQHPTPSRDGSRRADESSIPAASSHAPACPPSRWRCAQTCRSAPSRRKRIAGAEPADRLAVNGHGHPHRLDDDERLAGLALLCDRLPGSVRPLQELAREAFEKGSSASKSGLHAEGRHSGSSTQRSYPVPWRERSAQWHFWTRSRRVAIVADAQHGSSASTASMKCADGRNKRLPTSEPLQNRCRDGRSLRIDRRAVERRSGSASRHTRERKNSGLAARRLMELTASTGPPALCDSANGGLSVLASGCHDPWRFHPRGGIGGIAVKRLLPLPPGLLALVSPLQQPRIGRRSSPYSTCSPTRIRVRTPR